MPFVRQILSEKGDDSVWSVSPDDTLATALREMSRKNVAALIVMKDGEIVGIVSERDFVRKAATGGFNPDRMHVGELLNPRVLYTSPDRSAEDCMALMTDMRVRHLPVIENGALIGLISIGDIIKTLISEKEFLIDQLTRYISGSEKAQVPDMPAASASFSTVIRT